MFKRIKNWMARRRVKKAVVHLSHFMSDRHDRAGGKNQVFLIGTTEDREKLLASVDREDKGFRVKMPAVFYYDATVTKVGVRKVEWKSE